jgi:uncharacterized protein YndB with AHSA1/START domain
MSEQPIVSAEKLSITADYDLPEKSDKVWRALADPTLLAQWLMPNDIRAEVGHKFNFHAPPIGGWDGIVHCEVINVIPEQLLAYTWRGHNLDTVVTWTLKPGASGGTHLHLEHSGFDGESFAFKAMSQGWRGKIADRLTQILAAS